MLIRSHIEKNRVMYRWVKVVVNGVIVTALVDHVASCAILELARCNKRQDGISRTFQGAKL